MVKSGVQINLDGGEPGSMATDKISNFEQKRNVSPRGKLGDLSGKLSFNCAARLGVWKRINRNCPVLFGASLDKVQPFWLNLIRSEMRLTSKNEAKKIATWRLHLHSLIPIGDCHILRTYPLFTMRFDLLGCSGPQSF